MFSESSWFSRKRKIQPWKAKTKFYLWASFHDIGSSIKSCPIKLKTKCKKKWSEASSADQVNEWAVRAIERTDELVLNHREKLNELPLICTSITQSCMCEQVTTYHILYMMIMRHLFSSSSVVITEALCLSNILLLILLRFVGASRKKFLVINKMNLTIKMVDIYVLFMLAHLQTKQIFFGSIYAVVILPQSVRRRDGSVVHLFEARCHLLIGCFLLTGHFND